jgi:hypothetical protein
MNKKYDNNNIIIASRAYFLQQVVTFSDLHFISFLELTQKILMVVLHEHGMAVVFLIFMGLHNKLDKCVCVPLPLC